MGARSHSRGHPTVFDEARWLWLWADTGEPVDDLRPCARCGRPPTPEGHDACQGYIPGAESACCGHGVTEQHIAMEEGYEDENEAGAA